MDVSYINPFVSATIVCYQTMMAVTIKPGEPSIKKYPYPAYDISGVIGLSGEAQGSISLSYPEAVAIQSVKLMVGDSTPIGDVELADAIGEIANIVAGYAKKELTKFKLSISLPNVIIGKNHILANQSGSPTIVVPFSSEIGAFAMEVSLKTR